MSSYDENSLGGAANSPRFDGDEPDPADILADTPLDQEDLEGSPGGYAGVASHPGADTVPPRTVPGRLGDELMRRVESGLHRALEHVADQLDEGADQLYGVSQDRLGVLGSRGAPLTEMADGFAGRLNDAAHYLRTSELDGLQQDLTDHFRAEPLKTLLYSLGTGWILGKILR